MSTAWPYHTTGPCGHGCEVSMITPKPLSLAYFTITGAILARTRCMISPCWLCASSRASCSDRSKTFCLESICLRKVAAASSFILSPWVESCFLSESTSSLSVFSSVCLGSSFLVRTSISRRLSLEPKIAPSILMVPTLVPVAGGVAEAEEGALGTAAEAAGEAAVPAGAVCAHAISERLNSAATRILTNLLVIGSFELLRIGSGICRVYEQISTGLIGPRRRTRSASPVPGSSRRTSSVVTTQDFVGVDGSDYRRVREQRQTGIASSSRLAGNRRIHVPVKSAL